MFTSWQDHTVQQPKQRIDSEERRGIHCPGCGCGHFKVIYTRKAWGGRLRRRRECRYCGWRMTTIEQVLTDR